MEKKKIVLVSGLLLFIAIIFWTGSRYPQLNEKALMGEDAPTMGISFDIIKEIQPDDPVVYKIFYNTHPLIFECI